MNNRSHISQKCALHAGQSSWSLGLHYAGPTFGKYAHLAGLGNYE